MRLITIYLGLLLFLIHLGGLPTVEASLPRIRLEIEKPEDLGLKLDGLTVTGIQKDSLASKLGFKIRDVITHCEGKEVSDWSGIIQALKVNPYDYQFDLSVSRQGLSGEFKTNLPCNLLKGRQLKFSRFGEEIRIPLDIGLVLEGNNLRVASVINRSPCFGKLKPGDEIQYFQDKEVKSPDDIFQIIEEIPTATTICFKVQRNDLRGKNIIKEVKIVLSRFKISTSGGQGGQTGKIEKEIIIDGQARKYELVVPDSVTQEKPVPLILLLHGTDSYPGYMFYHWGPVVGNNAILAAPWGNRNWDMDTQKNDDELIRQMLEEIKSDYNINLARVYVSGHSRGAGYTYYWGATCGDIFAAAGMFAGGPHPGVTPSKKRKCSFIIYHGELDSILPVSFGRQAESALKTAGHYVEFIEEKGGTPDPGHHEMNRQGVEAIWDFFKNYTLLD